jgi:hypothetical protein
MRIRFYGSTKYRFIKLYLTEEPTMIQFANTNGYAIKNQYSYEREIRLQERTAYLSD